MAAWCSANRLLPRFVAFYACLGGLNFSVWEGLGPLSAQALLLPALAGVGFAGMRSFVFYRGSRGLLGHLKTDHGEN
jgi:hypothetical protein